MKFSSWSRRSQPVATMLLAAALSVTPDVGVRAQRASNRKPPQPTAPLALEIAEFASLPITGRPDGTGNNAGSLARLNVMRQEPGPAGRFFVNDLTGPLYILDPRTKSATTYLDFNGRGALTGLFDKLPTEAGLASGLISFELDPDYRRNGRFYTIHLEETALPGSSVPDNQSVRGLDVSGYTATAPIATPGSVDHEGVLIEWTDSTSREHDLRGPRPRVASHSPQQPDPSARRHLVQSGRAPRRRRLARAVRCLRRWRLR